MRAAARITRAATVKPRVARTMATAAASTRPEVVILSATRTPIGSFNGALTSFTGPQLGTIVIKDALRKANVKADQVDEAILGSVLAAGVGQAPARQAVLKAGLPTSVVCTTINKVCASGLKAVSLAAQSLSTGANQRVVVAGGFESMSNVPYYLPKARQGLGYGHAQLLDGVLHDGLWDATDNHHMGSCAEVCSVEYKIGREEQDKYAIESYRRAQVATKSGLFKEEITPVPLPPKRGSKESKDMTEDEEPSKVDNAKVPTLKPAFKKEGGTVTAANSSKLNDGAAALLLSTREYADANGLKPLARVLGYADAETKPVHFTIAPSLAVPKALANAGLSVKDVDYWEINEAFSVVALANMGLLKIDADRINVNGGAVALGHPIGGSGARIITTLLHVLRQKKARIGVASICNGGGGATAVVVENLQL